MTETTARQRIPQELISSTAFLLKRLGFAAKERGTDAYEAAGLHPYHHAVLAVVDEGERETQGEIADALGYDRGQLVGLLDELEEKGYVERERDKNDRRRQIVRRTPAGRAAHAKARELADRLDDEFLAPLDARERDELHRLLLRLPAGDLPACRMPTLPPK